ncbi:hypothetical protein [Solibacillus sp. FSL H8-0538]|uniref:hypothetical protein n=1 Tax=Solibacillus sp. FSL H8-0538 TaxID=2921400 RepID=UPI0030F7AD96
MNAEFFWHPKEHIKLPKWASYTTPFELYAFSATVEDEVLLLYNITTPDTEEDTLFEYKLVHLKVHGAVILHIKLPLFVDRMDQFSDGCYLFVSSRIAIDEGPNAIIANNQGKIVSQLLLGDGINYMQIDDSDRIWVGYTDEGVYGNFGWDPSNTIGREGVVVFNRSGKRLWDARMFDMVECSAMNINKEEQLFFIYDDFKLVKAYDDLEGSLNCGFWSIREQYFQHFVRDEDDTFIVSDWQGQVRRLFPHSTDYLPGPVINFMDDANSLLDGEILMRGNYVYMLQDDTIYRKEFGR